MYVAKIEKRIYYEDKMCLLFFFVYHTHLEALEAQSNDPVTQEIDS